MTMRDELGRSSAAYADGRLDVATGRVRRRWALVPEGLSTVSLTDEGGGEWIKKASPRKCDWELFAIAEAGVAGQLVGVTSHRVAGDLFDADHLAVRAEFLYPDAGVRLFYEVRAYPGAPGLWTRLSVQGAEEVVPGGPGAWRLPEWLLFSYGERLALDAGARERIAFGYYNDTQHRYHPDAPILREERRTGAVGRREIHDWASGLALESPDGSGLLLVKESHKCVNAPGIDTGAFILHPGEVRSTGLGFGAPYEKGHWLPHAAPRAAWAHWCVPYRGGDAGRERALKEFDRARFPFRPRRDTVVMANAWGTHGMGDAARDFVEQDRILREIESCADLGIDMVQIDDGWQSDAKIPDYQKIDWLPARGRLPGGWEPIRARAAEKGIALGLWFPWFAPAGKIVENHRLGGFTKFKLDAAAAHSREDLDFLVNQARAVIAGTGPAATINWDVTEQSARVGYYYAREYGNLFLQNNEVTPPGMAFLRHIAYTPFLTLRQTWHLARYMNLNQVQITVPNVDLIPASFSNAAEYGHAYCFAIAMMGLPLFFQETNLLSPQARDALRPLIRLYKEHRAALLSGFVHPVGGEPDDASFTGFQCCLPDGRSGYLTLFREIGAEADTAPIRLRLPQGSRIGVENLVDGTARDFPIGSDDGIPFRIPARGGFLFLRYTVS